MTSTHYNQEMTQIDFLSAYARHLVKEYAWASDPDKLDRFMHSVEQSLSGEGKRWTVTTNPSAQTIWRALGGTGQVSNAKLRNLRKG